MLWHNFSRNLPSAVSDSFSENLINFKHGMPLQCPKVIFVNQIIGLSWREHRFNLDIPLCYLNNSKLVPEKTFWGNVILRKLTSPRFDKGWSLHWHCREITKQQFRFQRTFLSYRTELTKQTKRMCASDLYWNYEIEIVVYAAKSRTL